MSNKQVVQGVLTKIVGYSDDGTQQCEVQTIVPENNKPFSVSMIAWILECEEVEVIQHKGKVICVDKHAMQNGKHLNRFATNTARFVGVNISTGLYGNCFVTDNGMLEQ